MKIPWHKFGYEYWNPIGSFYYINSYNVYEIESNDAVLVGVENLWIIWSTRFWSWITKKTQFTNI